MEIPSRVNQRGRAVPAFVVDDCFADEVKRWKWYENSKGYLLSSRNSSEIWLHRFIWELAGREPANEIDHINRNPKDNRLKNLRAATDLLNSKNMRRRTPTRKGLPQGVRKERSGRFRSHINHRGMNQHLGIFDTPEEASAVYENAREILIEFANLSDYEHVLDSIAPRELLKGPRTRSTRLGLPVGVYRRKNGRFASRIERNKKTIHIGTFDTPEQAGAAYQEAKARIS